MSEFEQTKEYRQQRFDAALRFALLRMEVGKGDSSVGETMDMAVALADALLLTLEVTRTTTDEDTPF